VVRGRARVVTDPKAAEVRAGEILVAERTDPGWILLFAGAAGVVVERGSVLSHSAIVARELGIPAVVSVVGLTSWLSTGDLIEVNGTSGVITRIAEDAQPIAVSPMEASHAQ
jgi:pyruvate,water dikinase